MKRRWERLLVAGALVACFAYRPSVDPEPGEGLRVYVPSTSDTFVVRLPPGVSVVIGVPRWLGKTYEAITLGTPVHPRIHFRDSLPLAQSAWHELAHVAQLRERGWVRYYGGWLVRTAVHGYADNSMEKAAEEYARTQYQAYLRARAKGGRW